MSGHAGAGTIIEPRQSRPSCRTTLGHVAHNLLDRPSNGLSAWVRTTAGVVAFLLSLQVITGTLLAFYYVPSAESAHTTVAYVEKVVGGGSWIRAVHLYGSQWLTLALLLHIAQMLWRETYRRKPIGWLAAILLLGLVFANSATGYSLPWDARAYSSTSVAAGIAGGLPLVGDFARAWLSGGAELSTLTLSRFYALHALVLPALLLCIVVARLFVFREPDARPSEATTTEARLPTVDSSWPRAQLARNAVAVAVVFALLSLYASKFPAPLGPPPESAPPGYLPRPGAQFLWLFQLLKYFPTRTASLVATLLPAFILGALAALPFLRHAPAPELSRNRMRRRIIFVIFASTLVLVMTFTALAYLEDARDPRAREQMARQSAEEDEFRRAPFTHRHFDTTSRGANAGARESLSNNTSSTSPVGRASTPPPAAYTQHCAKCHGANGEGRSVNPQLVGVSARPRRSVEDLVAILNDPASYGLERRMPSFADKLSDAEKRAVAEWVASLK
jgi:ubiquinol-cytochrome c reductase cytochrome b subunit